MPNPNPPPPPKHTQFKKGEPSANPGGQPKGRRLSTWLMRIAEEPLPVFLGKLKKIEAAKKRGEKIDMTVGEAIARAAAAKAFNGDMFATPWIAERTEGKVKDVLKLEGESKLPHLSDEQIIARAMQKGKQK
jgi:hypothetical protein